MSSDRVTTLIRHGVWSRPTRGVYDTAPTPSRGLEAGRRHAAWLALLAFGPQAVAVGPCALALSGVRGLPARVTPQAALPGGRFAETRDGVLLREFDAGMTVVSHHGRWVASPEWALAQTVPETGRRTAVALMDSALHLGLLDDDGLRRAHRHARGRRGVAVTHDWWELADGRAESPVETFARLDCIDGGLPPDELQVVVRDDDGLVLGRGDLGWRQRDGRWLIAEIDGVEFHDTPAALLYDRHRQNSLVVHGAADVLRFTARDTTTAGYISAIVRHHLTTARRTQGSAAYQPE